MINMSNLVLNKKYLSSKSQSTIRTILLEHLEEVELFSIISKLSAGGAVVRTLKAPKSTKKFFGQCGEVIKIAELLYTRNLTPYQPILSVTLNPHEKGTEILLHCAPHPKMYEFGILYNLAGVLLLLGTIPLIVQRPVMATLSGVFGGLLLLYPKFRAGISFDEACSSALDTFASLPLDLTED